ncbi:MULTISPECIES: L-glutamate gamma-semialdehyde dehydrogenase [unclassified Fusibacter]|uniref:L-glutamate gamma-semialdehyde dehydrogenase n=1 Tax=unclassified Fusibacter TaxID=2624464 RepID=UPI0010105838|nr:MULTISPECIES: L-glutamate gamma-semialdehyde dehydrogenase [unclassified Fusibacter]MCK8058008.1 L-glutamate gamma-semialdehyde dehydrogenase [Fusibacter sp. A2]NPE20590.1 L-glutamate gamma-semialdehyde dehydrogenase [Fusibacter sp. A1]RXV62797.1 L-glutamate gamma-semialdehyde dehydrogenase [Fusibacter sp. A1]
MNGIFRVKAPVNEPINSYAPGTKERLDLEAKLNEMSSEVVDIPLIIAGKEIRTGNTAACVMPHDHQHVLGHYHIAGPKEIEMAIKSSLEARAQWASTPWEQRVAVFLKAAELIATKYRSTINAATMLAQSKNAYQAEIDAACELIDFLRFNASYAQEIYMEQPASTTDVWNRLEHRGLEGFIYAISPFNFTAIGGNLPSAPALMGNVAVWKPASVAVYSNYIVMKIFMEAGLPAGVINFIPGSAKDVTDACLSHPDLAGIHFTGSTAVFQSLWKTVGENIASYKTYPRLVGETGGKDFVFAHNTADVDALAVALVRGAFEYQGQKCSAASRAYLPKSIAKEILDKVKVMLDEIKMGDVRDFKNFINAVIDQKAYTKIKRYIDDAKLSQDSEVFYGGSCDDSKGYFIEPTILLAKKPDYITMCEEIFGPVLTVFVYEDDMLEETLESLDTVSSYALTGAIFSQDRYMINYLERKLVNAAGNFYINDKPTGAVVGQQPFGGSRASGTNDKAGSKLNLLRWVTPRTLKENFNPPTSYRYPFMD